MKQFEGQDILNFIKELPNDDACKVIFSKNKNGIFKHILMSFVLELIDHNLKLAFFIKQFVEWLKQNQYIKIN